MAIGDAAAAKGLVVYPSTQDKRLGYQNDNQRGDELAAEITARETAISDLTTKLGVTKIIISTSTPTYQAGALWLKPL